MPPIAQSDLDEILAATAPLWSEMRGERLFITGGTGFFGRWLVESFLHINRVLDLRASVTVLTRDPVAFLNRAPHLRDVAEFTLLLGDVRNFSFPSEPYGFLIHAATEASAQQLADHPHQMLSTLLAGTERTLTFASRAQTRKLLLTSSGAVYGPQPSHLTHVSEDYQGAPDPLLPRSVYGEGKRASELLCALAANSGLEIKIARCFAFVGPHLPLDTHFAAGNFLADALAQSPVRIASDGSSIRSYLYASELAIWLWTILFRAPSMRAFNVGSEEQVSIRRLAETVATIVHPHVQVVTGPAPATPSPVYRYVPSVSRAQLELGLKQNVSLTEALRRTVAWHKLK